MSSRDRTAWVGGQVGGRIGTYTPLPRAARLALVIAAIVFGVVDAVFVLADGAASATDLLSLLLPIPVALYAWRPPIAATSILAYGVLGLALGAGAPQVFVVAVTTGLTVSTCVPVLLLVHGGGLVLFVMAVAVLDRGLSATGVLGVLAVGAISSLMGWAFGRIIAHQRTLAAQAERARREVETAVRVERERIADELHDIVAHDITIVAMHARALELTNDPESRRVSAAAVADSAAQAMTDIRRMLEVVRAGAEPAVTGAARGSLPGLLEELRREVEQLGGALELALPEHLEVSEAVGTTLARVAREAVTNAVKHGDRVPAVRIAVVEEEGTVRLAVSNRVFGDVSATPATPDAGYGLTRMRARVEVMGGTLSWGPASDERGSVWLVTAVVPRR